MWSVKPVKVRVPTTGSDHIIRNQLHTSLAFINVERPLLN
jgi:hypothetical protein